MEIGSHPGEIGSVVPDFFETEFEIEGTTSCDDGHVAENLSIMDFQSGL